MFSRLIGILGQRGHGAEDGFNLRLWFGVFLGFLAVLAGVTLIALRFDNGGAFWPERIWLLALYLFYMSLCCTFFPAPTAWLVLLMASPMFGLVAPGVLENNFGIGAESYTTGSHEFYMGYAVSRQKLLCLDAGHFHPTECISDKISSVMQFVPELLLHVSRPVRWDSDHVVILNDELRAIGQELVRSGKLDRIHIGLDFFDASINRIAAWVIGTRNMLKALLLGFLEPVDTLKNAEIEMDFTTRLAMLEELKTMPYSAVWDYYCMTKNSPSGLAWLDEVKFYEKDVLSKRTDSI